MKKWMFLFRMFLFLLTVPWLLAANVAAIDDHVLLPERRVSDYNKFYFRGSKSTKTGKSAKSSKAGKSTKRSKRMTYYKPCTKCSNILKRNPKPKQPQLPDSMKNAVGCGNNATLSNGATLSAIISLLDGAIFRTSDKIQIDGNASIGQGTKQGANHWTYVIDISKSTTDNLCGIPGNDTATVLDCEKQAVLDLHEHANGSAVDFGLTSFSGIGKSTNFNGSFVTTDRGTQENDIFDAVDALEADINLFTGGTNYVEGLKFAANSVNASSAGNKYVIFLSDGQGEGGAPFEAALDTLKKNLSATILSFAVGNSSSCTAALLQMANETGGVCKNVTNAADLSNELKNLVKTKMMKDGLTVDGISVGAKHPEFDGPGKDQLSYTVPASSLAVGNHTACISATGRGPADNPASEKTARCCVTFEVKE